jgi:hypothetical protein
MEGSGTAGNPPPAGPRTDRRLRIVAVPVLVGLVAESLVGSRLATAGSPYPTSLLATHIGLSIALVLLTGYAVGLSIRLRASPGRVVAALTFVATLGATASGTVFLLAGQSGIALGGMEGLAVVAILGAILLLVWGSVKLPGPSPAS